MNLSGYYDKLTAIIIAAEQKKELSDAVFT